MAKEYFRMLRELDRSPPRRRAKNHTTQETSDVFYQGF